MCLQWPTEPPDQIKTSNRPTGLLDLCSLVSWLMFEMVVYSCKQSTIQWTWQLQRGNVGVSSTIYLHIKLDDIIAGKFVVRFCISSKTLLLHVWANCGEIIMMHCNIHWFYYTLYRLLVGQIERNFCKSLWNHVIMPITCLHSRLKCMYFHRSRVQGPIPLAV